MQMRCIIERLLCPQIHRCCLKLDFMALVPASLMEKTEAMVKAKMDRMRKAASSDLNSVRNSTKKVRTGGLNLRVIIWNVSKKKTDDGKDITNMVLYVQPFDEKIVDGLDERFYKYDHERGCVSLAIQRFMTLEDAKNTSELEKRYPTAANGKLALKWADIHPGDMLDISDWNDHSITSHDVFSFARIFDLKARYRKPGSKNVLNEPVDDMWGWKWDKEIKIDGQAKRLNPRAMRYIGDSLPLGMFLFQDQRYAETDQKLVMMRLFPEWDTATLQSELYKPISAVGQWMTLDDSFTTWAISPKEPNPESCALLPRPEGMNKDLTVKALSGFVVVTQSIEGKGDQAVAVRMTLGPSVLESITGVQDLSLHYYRMRKLYKNLPLVLFCSIGAKNTKGMAINQERAADAGKWRSGDEEAKEVNEEAMESKDDGAAGASADAGAGDEHMTEEERQRAEYRRMMKLKEQKLQSQAASGGGLGSGLKADFGVQVYVNNVLLDSPEVVKRFMIPVPAKWPTELNKIGKDMVPNPFDRVHMSPVLKKFQEFPSKKDLNLNSPQSLPELVCVSDYTPDLDLVDKFVALVKTGKGTFHVMVNSTTYDDPDKAARLFEAIPHMTPEEGSELLSKCSVTIY